MKNKTKRKQSFARFALGSLFFVWFYYSFRASVGGRKITKDAGGKRRGRRGGQTHTHTHSEALGYQSAKF